MPASASIVVGAPGDADLSIQDFEAIEDVLDLVREALVARRLVRVHLARPKSARSADDEATLSVATAFEGVLQACAAADQGEVVCYVSSELVRDRLEALRLAESHAQRRYQRGLWSIVIRTGDITSVVADAVVNASNTRLQLGSGVSGALRRACGPGLQREMSQAGGVSIDGMAITGAHDLRTTERILHVPTVSGQPEVVRSALDNILRYCAQQGLRSVAIPALGTGAGGLAASAFAGLCVEALLAAEQLKDACTVVFVLWDAETYAAVERALDASDLQALG